MKFDKFSINQSSYNKSFDFINLFDNLEPPRLFENFIFKLAKQILWRFFKVKVPNLDIYQI
ncbi:hypothetical protein [Campylobacter geochelonis]|uniref:hypothetical protein n=1 Tax=Campylobacter geochelonis TaxID=1780362 RepID=UPI00094CAB9D|nr:hypothetical protein [Campylobacter geochelonis]